MKPQFIEDQVARQPWVKPAEKALDTVSNATVRRSGSLIKNFLHGVWLKHPFHPAITDFPIGAFTTAAVLDLMDAGKLNKKHAPGADAAVGFGLVTASLAAVSGLADWSHSEQPARRVGVLHAAMNGGATLLYLTSWLLRRRGERPAAVGTGLLGWVFLFIGAFLGGRMVFSHKMGVDHAQREGLDEFTAVMPDIELPENEPHRAEAHGIGILLVKQHGKVFAIGERCAHLGGPLAEGQLGDGTIQCPWHGSKFSLADGSVIEGPSAFPQPCMEARVRNGQIEVRFLKRH